MRVDGRRPDQKKRSQRISAQVENSSTRREEDGRGADVLGKAGQRVAFDPDPVDHDFDAGVQQLDDQQEETLPTSSARSTPVCPSQRPAGSSRQASQTSWRKAASLR